MSRKDIQKRVFMQAGRQSTESEPLRQCPFYNDLIGCEFDTSVRCNYHEGKSIPGDCPMKDGSVTLIYYVEEL